MRRWKRGSIIQELCFSECLNLETAATGTMEFGSICASTLARGVRGVTNGTYFCSIHNYLNCN